MAAVTGTEHLGRDPGGGTCPPGVDPVHWEAARDELLCGDGAADLDGPEIPGPEELEAWALAADPAAFASGCADREDGWVFPEEELSGGLADTARALGRASVTGDEATRVLDSGLSSGIEALGRARSQADALVARLALEAMSRGLHSEKGLSLVDWLRARCPWMPVQEASQLHQICRCLSLPSGGPLEQVVTSGAAPLHRSALVARTLIRIVKVCDVDQHEGYTQILAAAAANPLLSDQELARACAKVIRDLLDQDPGRERTAHELRTVTRRSVGEGLTRFTVDAPDEAAATLDGVLTGALAAPTPTKDEDGSTVPDPRSAGQRRFDALMTVVKRGMGNPGAGPSTARAAIILTIPFDPERGRPAGAGFTPGGLLVSPAAAGQLACGGVVTPVWVGPGDEPLALGQDARLATPGQWKALVVRDQHCTFPGCSRLPQWCDAHHLDWWSRGGDTDVDKLALLCEQHHTMVHQHDIVGRVVGGHVVWHT